MSPGLSSLVLQFSAFFTLVLSAIAFGERIRALMKTYPAATVAPLSLLVPVSGIATSWLVFDEHFAPGVWFGIAIMLAGVVVLVVAPRRAPGSKAVR
ncbi:MAG: EamA family transporter [Luteibacter sp.]